jgi:hypothetical protein
VKKLIALIVVASMLVLTGLGCGSKDTKSTAPTAAPGTGGTGK